MAYEYKDRGERKSWAEIDKARNRSSHRKPSHEEREAPQDRRAMSVYKSKLEQMFSPAKIKKAPREQNPALQKLKSVTDRAEFIALADTYLAANGIPVVWEDLEVFLRHKEPSILREVVERMAAIAPEQTPIRKENFKRDLHVIEMTTRDKELRIQARRALELLG